MNALIIPPQKNPLLEVSGLVRREWFLFWQAIPAAITGMVRMGTWAELQATAAGDVQDGTLYAVTDRDALYQSRSANRLSNWVFIAGEMRGLLSGIPSDLGPNDAGFRFVATNFRHTYAWNGSAWDYADADHSGRFADFAENPGTGWHICDGTAGVVRSRADGTTATINLPNLNGVYRKGAAAYSGSVTAAANPTLSGTTGDTSGGTPSGTMSGATTSADSTANTAGTNVQSGSDTSVASFGHTHTHSHTVSGSFSGSALPVHHHDLSAASVSLAGGDPVKNLEVMVYFRL